MSREEGGIFALNAFLAIEHHSRLKEICQSIDEMIMVQQEKREGFDCVR